MSQPKATMRSWIALILPASVPVIFDGDPEPTAPRPNVSATTPSYAAIIFSDDESPMQTAYENTTDEAATGTKVNQYRSQLRQGTLVVDLYGPGADDYCRALDLSRGRADVLALLAAAGDFAVSLPSDIANVPILRAATREPAASITFRVQWVESEIYETEAVAVITATADIDQE